MRLAAIIISALAMSIATYAVLWLGGYWIVGGCAFIGLVITLAVVSSDDGAPVTVWAAYSLALALIGAVVWPLIPSVTIAVVWRRARASGPSNGVPGPGEP